jgi:hypothetical protein
LIDSPELIDYEKVLRFLAIQKRVVEDTSSLMEVMRIDIKVTKQTQ